MGCCTITPEKIKADSIQLDTKHLENVTTLETAPDKALEDAEHGRLEEVYTTAKTLQQSVDWKVISTGPPSVKFLATTGALATSFRTPRVTDPYSIVKLLLDPLYRVQWDTTVLEFDTICVISERDMIQRTVQAMVYPRERLERVAIKTRPAEVLVLTHSYSVARTKESAAVTAFVLEIFQKKQWTLVEVTSQVDWQLPVTKTPQLMQSFADWALSFHWAVQNILPLTA